MTASGTRPQSDDPGPEQEGIWEEPPDAAAGSPSAARNAGLSSGGGGLTGRLTSKEVAPGPAGLVYADVPNRIIALIIDVLVLSVSGFALAWLLGGLVSEPGAIDSAGGELDIVAFLVVLVLQLAVSFAYFGGTWTLLGSTAGMRLLGLRIGDESDGHLISWGRSLVRWLLLGIPALLSSLAIYVPNPIGLILWALGVAWMGLLLYTMAQSLTKQGLHDRYARTIVVRARRRSR
jgi:uncharacterized RDD family membrane protein YckC